MTDSQASAMSGPMPTKLVIYISRPAPALTMDDVRALMLEACGFNLMNGVMGLLTYDPRGFLQVIEGTMEAIDDLIVRIARDTRHHSMQMLFEGAVAAPQFITFHDAIRTVQSPASLALLSGIAQARLSPDIVTILQQGFAMLDRRDDGEVPPG